VQPFLDAWQQDSTVQSYAAGGNGPKAGEELLTRDGRVWHRLG
jgi:glucose-6-phosphate 1-dehydrogenase